MIFRATAVLFGSRGMMSAAQFARNILIARLLSVEDFGVATTFAIVFTLIEMATDIGLNRMIVQDRDGNTPKFMATLHGIQLLRGILGAAVLFLLAAPLADLLGVPDLVWAYQLMALVPLIRGFMHYDIFRAQRDMQFLPMGLTQGLSPVLSLGIIAATYLITPDYRVMLWAVIGQQVIEVVLSHLLARRPYRLGLDRVLLHRVIGFGLPLMLNGLVMFAVMNGDRVIVGNQLGMEALGLFSAAFLLTLIPSTVLASTQSGVMLPPLSQAQDDPAQFNRLALICLELTLLLGLALAIGTALFGPAVLLLAFGEKYAPALTVLILLGAMQAARLCKAGPATIAVARKHTMNPLIANLVRLTMLPFAFLAVQQGHGLLALALIALAGEMLAVAVSVGLLWQRLGVPVGRLGLSYLLFLLTLAAVIADALLYPPAPDILGHAHMAQIGLIALFALFCLSLTRLRGWALERWRASRTVTPHI